MFLPQKHKRDVLVQYPNRAIMPGEEGEITIQYYTSETGSFSRSVRIYSNASDKAEKLTLRGSIRNIYANALTACPSFRNNQNVQTSHYNIVVVVDRATRKPITGASVELLERNKRKSVSLTSPQGKSTNKVERGKYLAIVTKDGYRKAEQELYFEKGTGVHVVYLDRDELRAVSYELRDDERDMSDERPQISEDQEDEMDLGINTDEQWDEASVASSSDARWDEPEVVFREPEETEQPETVLSSATEPISDPVQAQEEFDLGISTNDQWEEPQIDSDNEQPVGSEPKASDLKPRPNIEAQVESALAASEPTSISQPPPTGEPEFSKETYRPNNVLLLIDVSGSMKEDDKMEKLKLAVRRLIMMLREVDVLTLIAYNSSSWEVLAPTSVEDNEAIVALIDSLQPYGYTNGVKGMETAYESLNSQLIIGGNNQLIIATDGKFNSSKFSEKEAIQMVKNNSDKGIVLSLIGFGEDKEATKLMRRLAKEGDGTFMQINRNEDPTELLAEEIKTRSRKL